MSLLERAVIRIRGWLYRHGRRPAPGSIWHSPSLALIYGYRDAEEDARAQAVGYSRLDKLDGLGR